MDLWGQPHRKPRVPPGCSKGMPCPAWNTSTFCIASPGAACLFAKTNMSHSQQCTMILAALGAKGGVFLDISHGCWQPPGPGCAWPSSTFCGPITGSSLGSVACEAHGFSLRVPTSSGGIYLLAKELCFLYMGAEISEQRQCL